MRSLKIWEILSPLYLAKDVCINEKSFIVYKAFNLFASMYPLSHRHVDLWSNFIQAYEVFNFSEI